MNNINEWVINWFVENSDAEEEDIKPNIENNYFESGWIDSFEFMNLISDIEDEFEIEFSNDEFQNRDFATINGLIKILKGRMG